MDLSPLSRGRMLVGVSLIALLAVSAWFTMQPGKYRELTLILLGFFAFRAVLTGMRTR